MSDVELLEKGIQLVFLLRCRELCRLQDSGNVLHDSELTKDGRLLREVADAEFGTAIHGIVRDADVGEIDITVRRLLQTDDHVECRRLSGTIRSEESDDLALVDAHRDAVDHGTAAELLDETAGFKMHCSRSSLCHSGAVIGEVDGHVIAARCIVALIYPRIPIQLDVGSWIIAIVVHAVAASLKITRGTRDMCVSDPRKAALLQPSLEMIR